jgi:hypothetical protein
VLSVDASQLGAVQAFWHSLIEGIDVGDKQQTAQCYSLLAVRTVSRIMMAMP